MGAILSKRPIVSNNNQNVNKHSGIGDIINNNQITNVFNAAVPQESEAIQAKITAVLQPCHVPKAEYNAQLGSGCMDGTRVQVLREIGNWIKDLKEPQIFWLAGMAGTGKSAIAWTVCSRAKEDPEIILGGSFFCSRSTGSVTQRDPRCIVPTLAQLMARQSSEFSKALAGELARDPDVLHKQVDAQIEQLLYKPLQALKDSRIPVLFVIDALDECGGQSTSDSESHVIVSAALEALVAFSRRPIKLPIKFLVTSRPETHIRDTSISDATSSTILRLHTIEKDQVTADIRLYIDRKLSSDRRQRHQVSEEDAAALARVCDGLFIVAATALQFVLGFGVDVAAVRFKILLNSTKDGLNIGAAARLDCMYALIVEEAAKTAGGETYQLPDMRRLLASLLSAQTTLSVATLADLMGQAKTTMRASLSRLHAVVHVPDDDEQPDLRTLHASFGDYLFDRAPSSIRIPESLGHEILSYGCLDVMAKHLYLNISQSRSSYEENSTTRPTSITQSLEYACLQWIYHVSQLPDPSMLDRLIDDVFRLRFLFWLEVVSVLGRVRRAAAMLLFAASTVRLPELSQFLRDAHAFVSSSHEVIEISAPHIYLSALPFATKFSLVYRTFFSLCTGIVSVETFGIDRHGGRLVMALTGHQGQVNSVAYSPDSRFLASGSDDGTIRIWDTHTGEDHMPALRSGDGAIRSVVFAPDGRSFASGTETGVICIWNRETNQIVPQRLLGHTATVYSLAFSFNGSRLASASRDETVRLWRPETGQLVATLYHHYAGGVRAVSFSADGLILASCQRALIRLWNGVTGESLDGTYHIEQKVISDFLSISFSPDGGKFAAGSSNHIFLWKTQTWERITTLYGHLGQVTYVQFSPDGSFLLSAGNDAAVCIWTFRQGVNDAHSTYLQNGRQLNHFNTWHSATLSPDGMFIASAFCSSVIRILDAGDRQALVRSLQVHDSDINSVSSNGTVITSGSSDHTVRVWDAQTGEPRFPMLLGHTGKVLSVTLSPDGRLIASGSCDHTVRLWDAQTGKAIGKTMPTHTERVNVVVFSSDGRWLASGSDDKTVCLWNVITGQPSKFYPLRCYKTVHEIDISPDNRLIAAATADENVHLWDVGTDELIWNPFRVDRKDDTWRVRLYHGLAVVKFSHDSSRIFTVLKGDDAVCVWDVVTRQPVLRLELPNACADSIAFSPDGNYIVAGALVPSSISRLAPRPAAVRLWTASTGMLIATLCGHGSNVKSVAFTPNGRSILSCSQDSIRVWDVTAVVSPSSTSRRDPIAALSSTELRDGWLLGPNGELLLWIPAEYRAYIQVPPCTTLIAKHRVVITGDDKGLHAGEDWTLCWRGNASNPLSRPL